MLPRLSPNQEVQRTEGNPVLFCESLLRDPTSSIAATDFTHQGFGEFGGMILLAANSRSRREEVVIHSSCPVTVPVGVSSLSDFVVAILLIGSKKQMIGAYARRTIAAMQDKIRGGIDAVMEEVSVSVGLEDEPTYAEPSVPSMIKASGPQPARIGLPDFREVSLPILVGELGKWSKLGSSHLVSFADQVVRVGRMLSASPGSFYFTQELGGCNG